MLTMFDDDDNFFEVIKSRVNGYILKDKKGQKSLKCASDGGIRRCPMSPGIAGKEIEMLINAGDSKGRN